MGPKKYLGQHFLTAPAFAKKIAAAIPASGNDNVLEIGPGKGALSVHLIDLFPKMHFVEIDRDAIAVLREKLEGRTINTLNSDTSVNTYTIHNEDVMTFDFSKAGFPLHIAGNLPYNIGAIIIKKTLLYAPQILSCTFMVQKEVAARITASPHSKENGWLSIFCGFFGTAKLLFHVPPGAFFPRPNVDSSVFQIIVDGNVEKKLDRPQWNNFFAFVDGGFSMRRKQLAKVLTWKFGRDKEFYASELVNMGIDAAARPEDLGVDRWLELYKRVNQ